MVSDCRERDPKQIVADGYDRIVEHHSQWASRVRAEERARYTTELLVRLPPGAQVLELGCGAGLPTTRQLAERFHVTAVDISAGQIARARQNVPAARFIHADMTELDFPKASFDAVAAFYSLIHVPRQEQPGLLESIASWLRPGGLLVATMGTHATEAGVEQDWLGAPMYWSSFDSQTNRRLVTEAGLHMVSAREETAEEFGQPVTFLWIIGQRPASLCRGQQDRQRSDRMRSLRVEDIYHYLAISDSIGTAGQPTAQQFIAIREAGYDVVVNLALPDSPNALSDERVIVTEQGMGYVHIPVVWENPTIPDLERFFTIMERHREKRLFVHCAANMRVSAFILLYRVIRQGVSLEAATETMLQIWEPNEIWQSFVEEALARDGTTLDP